MTAADASEAEADLLVTLKEAVVQELDQKESLNQIKAQLRAAVFEVFQKQPNSVGSSRGSPAKSAKSEENLVIDELIREYLKYNNYGHSLSVLEAEAGLTPKAQIDRTGVQRKLGVNSPEPNNKQSPGSPSRFVSTSSPRRDIFTVQDADDFKKKVSNSKEPVVVDFYATWCGPCKILTPRLETIVGGKKGKIHLAKVDIDENEDLATEFKVNSVPSVFMFKKGKITDQFVGVKDDDQIRAFVEKAIGD